MNDRQLDNALARSFGGRENPYGIINFLMVRNMSVLVVFVNAQGDGRGRLAGIVTKR